MIRICHVVDELRMGGLEKNVIQISSGLDKKRFCQQIWCLKEKGALAKNIEDTGVKVRSFHFEGRATLSKILKLSGELKQEKFDIVHGHDIYPSIWAITAAIFAGIPFKIMQCQSTYYMLPRKDKVRLKILSLFINKFIAVSEAVKLSLIKFVGIDQKKTELVYNSAKQFNPAPAEKIQSVRRGLGINEGDFVLASISRLEALKGHSYLIESIALLKSITNLKCLIIGDGEEKCNLQIFAENLGLKDRVIFTGIRSDIEELLSVADIYVQPSAIREGLPLTLAEAASAGLPLIATNIGGNPEIVKDSVNGFIVESKNPQALADKILYLFKNTEERNSMGKNSHMIWQERFSEESMLEKIKIIYESAALKYA